MLEQYIASNFLIFQETFYSAYMFLQTNNIVELQQSNFLD